ncbi:DUF1178 domain-containing protein [Aestuariivirga litoralis]|uniref:DUF1178 domain-containing protein n=1 Tax=Aestuariivirga litoralis TaxID=2650924 RepID=A0A2W2BZG0_9HYPH|nr:DUF1178 family protein [Aestuariivirga litoralis]PZF78886.1 DUF1178 domain-containing protein [Aestuariivirga litoralis]
MIHYDLICDKGHAFDGWFRNSAAYDEQAGRGLVTCTQCGSTKVEKQLMAPGIPVKSNRKSDQKMVAAPADPRLAELMTMMREMRRHVEENAEYVGDRFAEEARKIHYEESDARGIYGNTSPDEAKALIEEGIAVHPLPRLPEDGN